MVKGTFSIFVDAGHQNFLLYYLHSFRKANYFQITAIGVALCNNFLVICEWLSLSSLSFYLSNKDFLFPLHTLAT